MVYIHTVLQIAFIHLILDLFLLAVLQIHLLIFNSSFFLLYGYSIPHLPCLQLMGDRDVYNFLFSELTELNPYAFIFLSICGFMG